MICNLRFAIWKKRALLVLLATVNYQPSTVSAQGSLTPPGAPAPMMKTLAQVEPRTPISNLPYTITQPGSYYVTTNLMPAANNQNGIVVAANDVTIDLAGFTLVGGGGVSGEGISASGARANIIIRNGTVRNWPGSGVNFYDSASSGVSVQNIHSVSNVFTGIAVRNNSQAMGCAAEGNSQSGILVGNDCQIERCRAQSNGGSGIVVGNGFTILDCTAAANHSSGISAGSDGTIRGCTARGNSGTGFVVGDGATVVQCASGSNSNGFTLGSGIAIKDCTARGNVGIGISVGTASMVSGCAAVTNSNDGFAIGDGATVVQCASGFNSNGGDGFSLGHGVTAKDCTAVGNNGNGFTSAGADISPAVGFSISGCTVLSNRLNGIKASSGCRITDNSCVGNGSAVPFDGIYVFGRGTRVEGNNVVSNAYYGIALEVNGNMVIRNTSRGNGTGSYSDSLPVNAFGQILNYSSGGTITNANPWANFEN